MSTPLLFDLGTAAFLLLFIALGALRGLYKTLTSFLTVIAAIVGAAWLSATFTPAVTAWLYPYAEEKLLAWLSVEGGGEALASLLTSFGVDAELADALYLGAGNAADGLLRTALESVLQVLVQGALLLVSFLVLLLALKLLAHIVGLVFKLPVLHTLDKFGGALFGLFEGAALAFLIVYIARSLGSDIFSANAEGTYLLSVFVEHTPKTLLAELLNLLPKE